MTKKKLETFVGFTAKEIAQTHNVSLSTARRDIKKLLAISGIKPAGFKRNGSQVYVATNHLMRYVGEDHATDA